MTVAPPTTTFEPAQDPAELEICNFLRSYAQRPATNPGVWDKNRAFGPGVVSTLASAGVMGLQIPRRWGGQGLSTRSLLRVIHQLGAIDCNLVVLVAVQNTVGIPPVLHHATEALQEKVLPLFAAGHLTTSAATEPGMGSNLRGIAATARRNTDGTYTLNGEKRWISLGAESDYLNTFTRLIDADGRDLGYAGFCINTHTPGFSAGGEEMTVGLRAVPQHALRYDNLTVPPEALLGGEGDGLIVANSAFRLARLALGASITGAAKQDLRIAAGYAKGRKVATGNLADNRNTHKILANGAAAVAASEALLEHVTRYFDRGQEPHELLYLVVKATVIERLHEVMDRCMQMLGARGYMLPNHVGKDWADYRLFRIFEGATEAVIPYIGKRLQRSPAVLQDLLGDFTGVPPRITALIDQAEDFITRHTNATDDEHLIQNAIGDLACYAILAAAATTVPKRNDEIYENAQRWCAELLEERLAHAERDVKLSLPSLDGLLAHIDGFADDIGEAPGGTGDNQVRDPLIA